MTLLAAVQSLAIIEMAAVSWIKISPLNEQFLAVFIIALQLPFADLALPEELRTGPTRRWPDQERILEKEAPIEEQIIELHTSRLFGNLAWVYLTSVEGAATGRWFVKTHAGTHEERLAWMRSVIEMEERFPAG